MKTHILYLVCLANETGRTNLVWLGAGMDWLRSSSSYGLQKESAVTCAMQQMDSLHPIYIQAPKPLEALATHLPSGSRLWCPADGYSSHLAFALCGTVAPPFCTQDSAGPYSVPLELLQHNGTEKYHIHPGLVTSQAQSYIYLNTKLCCVFYVCIHIKNPNDAYHKLSPHPLHRALLYFTFPI